MTIQKDDKDPVPDYTYNVKKLLDVSIEDLDTILKHNGVTPNALNDMVMNVREWYEKQPHLPQGQLHDEVIIRRLITQGFSLERVKEKIDNYYTVKRKMSEIVCNRDPLVPQLDKCLKQCYWVVLPKKTPDNKRVTIFRTYPNNDVLITDMIKVAFMIGEYRLWNDDMGGDHWIFDFKNATIQQMIQFTPTLIIKVMFYLNYCFGPKVVGMHLVNLPSFATAIVTLFKKSMKAKMVERLYTYDNFEELYKIVPRTMFPKEYGGDEILSCQEISDEWTKTFQTSPWRDYFIEQDNVFTDEKKRKNQTKADEIFGVSGSFRKLDFD